MTGIFDNILLGDKANPPFNSIAAVVSELSMCTIYKMTLKLEIKSESKVSLLHAATLIDKGKAS